MYLIIYLINASPYKEVTMSISVDCLPQIIGERKLSADRKAQYRFVKGPIPYLWIVRAAALPGKALHVGVALWYLSGLKKNKTIKAGGTVFIDLGISPRAKSRALRLFKEAGLITVEQKPGRVPIVTLLWRENGQ